jgi:NADPH:quinone reductase-like Zn-dependent oxidoreductase
MKAAQMTDYGGNENLKINDVPLPEPPEDQILVEVYAASINPFDMWLRTGAMKDKIPLTLPYTVGGDFSGIASKTGEAIYGSAQAIAGCSGAFAEFATVKTDRYAPKPSNTTHEQAAALPLVGSSVIQALEEQMKLKAGQKILIHGGAGGIGHIAIQLAKKTGAYVATTVSADDIDFVRSLGADTAIDYKKQAFETILENFDAVYDTIGGDTTVKSFNVLHSGGILVSMKGPPDPTLAKNREVTAIGLNAKTNTSRLERLKKLVEEGQFSVHMDHVFPLAEIHKAFDLQAQGHPRGKVVISIRK